MQIGIVVGAMILFSLVLAPIVMILEGNWIAATILILILVAIFLQRRY